METIKFFLPECSQIIPAIPEIGPALGESLKYLFKGRTCESQITNVKFKMDPMVFCWKGDILLSCCICCCSPVLVPCMNCRNMARYTGHSCESQCVIFTCLNMCCLYSCYRAGHRQAFRAKYGISGSGLEDSLSACPCCLPCAVCQESTELMAREDYVVPCSYVWLNKIFLSKAKDKVMEGVDKVKTAVK